MTSEIKNRNGQKTAKAPRFNNSPFVRYELSKDEQARCKAWLPDLSDLDDAILKACQAGYKLTIKFDTYSSAYSAFMMDAAGTTENKDIINTGRGSTPLKAVKQALYKHYVVFDEQWSPFSGGAVSSEIDD